ncbi:hypothetical protein BsWGS_22103 [Bradybaena similaris]
MWTMSLASVVTSNIFLLLVLDAGLATNSEPCEYDLDLTKNTVKITCQGSPSVVNVYAEKALLQADQSLVESSMASSMMTGSSGTQGMHTGGPSTARTSGHKPGPPFGAEQAAYQRDRQDTVGRSSASFSDMVWNATLKLDKAKQTLLSYTDSIRNISMKLSEGDLLLRADMQRLRQTSNSATDLKSGIIAAMTNQYNFMRSALLARNYELEKLVASLTVLVEVTSDGLDSALKAHRVTMDEVSKVNLTLLAVRKLVSKELLKREPVRDSRGQNYEQCPKEISAIGSGSFHSVKWLVGAYMVQSVNPGEFRSVYVLENVHSPDQIMEYHSPEDVAYDVPAAYILLPTACSGTGHVVYRRHFYCHKNDTNLIMKFHLKKKEVVEELALPGAKFGNSTPYSSGEFTDIDLAVDEYGLWAIYATRVSAGKMVISKIDHKKMEIERSWMTSYPKKQFGNAFMICGVLYATNSHKDTPTFISYIYSTETNKEQFLVKGELPFPNSALLGVNDGTQKPVEEKSANCVMLSYDYRTSALYSWNNKRVETFPVYFKTRK